jgi:hypothetical protein
MLITFICGHCASYYPLAASTSSLRLSGSASAGPLCVYVNRICEAAPKLDPIESVRTMATADDVATGSSEPRYTRSSGEHCVTERRIPFGEISFAFEPSRVSKVVVEDRTGFAA